MKSNHQVGYVKITSMQLTNQGETETLTRVGVNQEPQFPSAEISQHVGTVTVHMDAEESTDVVNTSSGPQFYEKRVKTIQGPAEMVQSSSKSLPPNNTGFGSAEKAAVPGEPSALGVLKNFVDHTYDAHEAKLRSMTTMQNVAIFLGAIGAAGFILAVLSYAKVFL